MHRIAAALICGALVLFPVTGQADSGATLEELIVEMAETPKQHAALARYYRAKAEGARAEADRHDRIASSYRGRKRSAEREMMGRHCDRISEQLKAVAREYDLLGKLHDKDAE